MCSLFTPTPQATSHGEPPTQAKRFWLIPLFGSPADSQNSSPLAQICGKRLANPLYTTSLVVTPLYSSP
jgi:hypothetical protein